MFAACQDPEIPRWTTVPAPYTRDHAVDFVQRVSPDGWRDDSLYGFGIFASEGGETLVGTIALVRLAQLGAPQRQAELGFWTVAEHRGKGYTVEAGRALCRWAFEHLGVERVEWFAEAGNEGSRGVARSIGFVMEGTARAKIVQRGTRRDAWMGALLPSDLGLESATAHLPYPG